MKGNNRAEDRSLEDTPGDLLVVDDSLALLRDIEAILKEQGYKVRCVSDPQTALVVAANQPPELLLLDVTMPGLNGYEVCRKLKAQPETAEFPVLFLAALADREHLAEGFEAGGISFLTKPVQPEELLANVKTLVELHRGRKTIRQYAQTLEQRVAQRTAALQQANRQLEQSEKRYELAVTGSAAGIWDWDIRSDRVYYSDRFKELLGYAPGEFLETPDEFWSRLHPDDYKAVREAVTRHISEHTPYMIDCRLQMKSGEYRWLHARGQALWDETGQAIRMVGSVADVTAGKHAQEELMRSEERFRSLMEQSPLGIEILTPEGKISQVNSAWMRLWGFNDETKAQVLEKYNMLTDEQTVDIGIAPLIRKAFAGQPVVLPAVEYDTNRSLEELGVEGVEARSPWIQSHLYPAKDANGEITHVVNIYMDITELKRAELEAREQRESLARMDRATSMGQLTGAIAHELVQPLTGILSNAQAAELMLKSGRWEPTELEEILAEIVADAKRGGKVVQNLRELYGEQKVDLVPVDINAVVQDTTHLLRSEFVLQKVALTTDCPSHIPMVNGNLIQLQQVLVNLIVNGIQAMGAIEQELRRLHIVTACETNEVKVWVDDWGPGVDPDKIEYIFEPLVTGKSCGTGMGLAISGSIIRAHHGRIWGENRSGGGFRVGFALPVPKEGQ